MYWFAYSVYWSDYISGRSNRCMELDILVTAEFLQNATQVTSTQMPEIIPSHWLLLQLTDVMMTCRVMWKFSDPLPIHSKQQCLWRSSGSVYQQYIKTQPAEQLIISGILETEVSSSDSVFNYVFTTPGVYDVTLVATTDHGCSSTDLRRVTIFEKTAVVDFSGMDVCQLLLHSINQKYHQ